MSIVTEETEISSKSGFLFFIKGENGFEERYERHCGFYCVHSDESVSFVSNSASYGSGAKVGEQKFETIRTFKNWMLEKHATFINIQN